SSRLVPLITTLVSARPEVGEKLVMAGLPKKLEEVTKLPLSVKTAMGPVSTPTGGCTWISVSELAVKATPFLPLNVTFVAPVKCSPAIWTFVDVPPVIGEKSVMYGPGPTTINAVGLLLVPKIVLTVIGPLVAPAGTRVVICVPSALGVNWVALTPANLTPVVFVRCTPLIMTVSFTEPRSGVKLKMNGPVPTARKSSVVNCGVPAPCWILIGPVVMPLGTATVMSVSLLRNTTR